MIFSVLYQHVCRRYGVVAQNLLCALRVTYKNKYELSKEKVRHGSESLKPQRFRPVICEGRVET